MPGAARTASVGEMRKLAGMGIDFFDIYLSDMPADYGEIDFMAAMPALGFGWLYDEPQKLAASGFKLLEASIIHHEGYGCPLALDDFMAYSFIAEKFGGAVVIPTQRDILTEDIPALLGCGARGLMIGKVVAGDTPESFEKAAARFRKAIDGLE
jgi:hypothetical protein